MEIAPPFTLSFSSGNAELIAAVDHLAGEGLVQLPDPDVVDLQRPLRSSSFGTA